MLAPSVLLFTIESSVTFAPPPRLIIASASLRSRESLARLHSENGRGGSSSNNPTVDESATEYEYNEADFADYVSDYSSDSSAAATTADDLDDDDDDDDDGSVLLAGYDDYSAIGGFDLTPFEKHAREVFLTYALQVRSSIDHESDDLATSANEDCEETRAENAAIRKTDLFGMLQALDIDASLEESEALFKYLDIDDDGTVTLDEVSVSLSPGEGLCDDMLENSTTSDLFLRPSIIDVCSSCRGTPRRSIPPSRRPSDFRISSRAAERSTNSTPPRSTTGCSGALWSAPSPRPIAGAPSRGGS